MSLKEVRKQQFDKRMYELEDSTKRVETERLGEGRSVLNVFAIPFDTVTVLWADRWGEVREVIPSRVKVEYFRDDLYALHNHNWDNVLGRMMQAETMEVRRDTDGYHANVFLDERSSMHNDVAIGVERKEISMASFGFTPTEMTWHEEKDGPLTGYVEAMVLYEMTVTPIGQYENTDTSLVKRSLNEWRSAQDQMKRDMEAQTRERLALRLNLAEQERRVM